VLDPHGMPADPVTEPERLAKFNRLASAVLPAAKSATVIQKVRAIETLASVRDLSALLRA